MDFKFRNMARSTIQCATRHALASVISQIKRIIVINIYDHNFSQFSNLFDATVTCTNAEWRKHSEDISS